MEFMDRGFKQDEDKVLEMVQALVDRNKRLEKENAEQSEKILELENDIDFLKNGKRV